LRKEHAELEVSFETQKRELTIAKSDRKSLDIVSATLFDLRCFAVNLVNKDQLDILSSLRESLNEDKAGMEADMSRLKNQIRELSDKNKMQLEQVNALLLEKVNLQNDGIGQREKMLQRERVFG
jgi:protein HOOK3